MTNADKTPATDKQITAILNLRAWIKCGDKHNHSCLYKRTIDSTKALTKQQASKKIQELIYEIDRIEQEAENANYEYGNWFWK